MAPLHQRLRRPLYPPARFALVDQPGISIFHSSSHQFNRPSLLSLRASRRPVILDPTPTPNPCRRPPHPDLGAGFHPRLSHTPRTWLTRKHFDTVDDQKRRVRDLHRQNRELVANRELEMSNARLRERNRISTEIHDNVGHLLSSSILQVGALEIIASESERPYIRSLQQTLTDAMQQIRDSVHDIHRDSLNIYRELEQIQENFTFCRMTLTVAIEQEPDAKNHYTLLAIVREALTNTMKHSDATLVTVSLSESARQYHMIVTDNGKQKNLRPTETTGIGLMTMEDRVHSQGGTIHISIRDGFRIFVTLPATKKEKET